MKRFAAATLAVATALSLSTGAAAAKGLDASSKADREIGLEITEWHIKNPGSWTARKEPSSSVNTALKANESIKENSSEETSEAVTESSWGVAKSSLETDVENNDPFGTQLDSYLAIMRRHCSRRNHLQRSRTSRRPAASHRTGVNQPAITNTPLSAFAGRRISSSLGSCSARRAPSFRHLKTRNAPEIG